MITWKEFKAVVEKQGVKDDDLIDLIDYIDWPGWGEIIVDKDNSDNSIRITD